MKKSECNFICFLFKNNNTEIEDLNDELIKSWIFEALVKYFITLDVLTETIDILCLNMIPRLFFFH